MKEKDDNRSRRNFLKRSALATGALTIPGMSMANIFTEKIAEQIHGPVYQNKIAPRLSELTIDFDFENGNLGTHEIKENTVVVGPVSRHKDTWFSFKIKGVKHKKVTMVIEWLNSVRATSNFGGQVNNTAMITYDGKGFEIVKDVNFRLKDPDVEDGNFIQTLHHTFREDEAHVTYCAPWSNTRMAALTAKLESDPRVEVDNIGYSKYKKLPLTYYKITDKDYPDADKKKLFLIAREDSYEAGGSWAAEGVINFLLSGDPVANEMLKKMAFVIFPIFSVDGVAMGATNYPLKPDNSEFVYVTGKWDTDIYYEVNLMKDFWHKMKSEGFEPDVAFKFHATCYWENHFRPEDCKPENLAKERELLGILKDKLSWRIEAGDLKNRNPYMNYNFIKVFPDAITYSSHNDFIFTRRYLKTEKNVYRRHEDVLQDGELIARSFAEFYGIPSEDVAPYLMAGDVDTNCGEKGSPVTYSVYYYDIHGLPSASVEVIINKKAYKMTAGPNPDFSKPVKFTFMTTLNKKENDYSFRASNGKKFRNIPEEDYKLPGPFIVKDFNQ